MRYECLRCASFHDGLSKVRGSIQVCEIRLQVHVLHESTRRVVRPVLRSYATDQCKQRESWARGGSRCVVLYLLDSSFRNAVYEIRVLYTVVALLPASGFAPHDMSLAALQVRNIWMAPSFQRTASRIHVICTIQVQGYLYLWRRNIDTSFGMRCAGLLVRSQPGYHPFKNYSLAHKCSLPVRRF